MGIQRSFDPFTWRLETLTSLLKVHTRTWTNRLLMLSSSLSPLGSASCLISSPGCFDPLVWSFEHHCLWYMKWVAPAPFIPPLPCCSEGPALTQTQVRTCCVGGSAWASGSCWVLVGRHTSPPGCRNRSEVELAYLPGPDPPFLAWKLRSREVEPRGYGCSAKHSRVGCHIHQWSCFCLDRAWCSQLGGSGWGMDWSVLN